jgi:hypothetical protein
MIMPLRGTGLMASGDEPTRVSVFEDLSDRIL